MANPTCQWKMSDGTQCNDWKDVHVDHVIARENGGSDTFDNTQTLCPSHHSYKTAMERGGNQW